MKWKARLAVVTGNMLEFYDIAVFAAISGYLTLAFAQQGIDQASHIVWGIFALRFFIRPLGGYIIGRYADKHGRRSALILTSVMTGMATLLMGFLPIETLGYFAPLVFLLLQLVQAFSFGGEYPTMITYLFGDSGIKDRAKISSLIVGSSIVGVLFSLILVFVLEKYLTVENMQEIGWRIPLWLGVLNIGVSFWFRNHLPELPVADQTNRQVDCWKVAKIFLIVVPGAVIFYAQNMASGLLRDTLQLGELKAFYGIFSSGLMLFAILFCGWFTDRFSNTTTIFNRGAFLLSAFAVPSYFLLGNENVILILLAQIMITGVAAMILANLAAVLASVAQNQTVHLGLGYNIALSIFGGLTPLIIGKLLPFGMMFPGMYIAASGVTVLLANKIGLDWKFGAAKPPLGGSNNDQLLILKGEFKQHNQSVR